jgi:hypothetical protein
MVIETIITTVKIASLANKYRRSRKEKKDDDVQIKNAIDVFIKNPTTATLNDLYCAVMEFKSSGYKPHVFNRSHIVEIINANPVLINEFHKYRF